MAGPPRAVTDVLAECGWCGWWVSEDDLDGPVCLWCWGMWGCSSSTLSDVVRSR